MRKAILHVLNSPTELFEYARWDWKNDPNMKDYAKITMSRTESGDDFHGDQEKVYEKFIKHNVKREASLINDAIGDIKSLDFDEVKWKFQQRLTEGDSVDIARYLDGHERCWCGVKRQRKNKKVVRIYSGYGGHCGRSERELAVCGALAVTMCELLESIGLGVELWGATYSINIGMYGDNLLQLVKIKDSTEFADLGILNYITGNNHVLRNTVFRTWCRRLSEAGVDANTNLGKHGEVTKELLEGYDDGTSNGIIVIPSIYDINKAKTWLADQIKTLKESIN